MRIDLWSPGKSVSLSSIDYISFVIPRV